MDANFCFLFSFCGLVFLVGLCLCFMFIFLKVRPGMGSNILFTSGLVFFFWDHSLHLRVWVDAVVVFCSLFVFIFSFSFKRESSGLTEHHTPPRTCYLFFSFFCPPPPRTCLFACSGRASLLFWRFLGVPFWAPGFFWILSGLL